jgi:hypothetical protein
MGIVRNDVSRIIRGMEVKVYFEHVSSSSFAVDRHVI